MERAPQPGFGEQAARTGVLLFLLLAIVTLAFGLGWGVNNLLDDNSSSTTVGSQPANSGADPIGSAILNEIYQVLSNQYVDRNELDPALLRDAAITGALSALNDRETQYISPNDLKAGALDLGSSYQGIGASVSDESGEVRIIAPFRDSPAESAGIRAGDAILEVDGEKTDGWSDQLAVEKIRGPKGTEVTLKVRHTDGQIEELKVTRGEIAIESVFTDPNLDPIPGESGKKLVDREGKPVTDLCYVNISQFHDRTLSELRTKAGNLESNGCTGLILDLRSNGGGLLSATVDVADEFLDKGVILSEAGASGDKKVTNSTPGGILTDLPIVILQDAGSASGAEVLAAALHDNGRAEIVGTRSFGKGTVNQLVQLDNCGDPKGCGALYLSVGRWYTPDGQQIEGLGITPDVEVPMTYDDYVGQGDIQLF
ncbi:MAG TPA: S41 family peptidase, partial [Gemmatimonadales bacterium]|nr:S41 family peptidase [Gemmatimonadales bacterium]